MVKYGDNRRGVEPVRRTKSIIDQIERDQCLEVSVQLSVIELSVIELSVIELSGG